MHPYANIAVFYIRVSTNRRQKQSSCTYVALQQQRQRCQVSISSHALCSKSSLRHSQTFLERSGTFLRQVTESCCFFILNTEEPSHCKQYIWRFNDIAQPNWFWQVAREIKVQKDVCLSTFIFSQHRELRSYLTISRLISKLPAYLSKKQGALCYLSPGATGSGQEHDHSP